MINQNWQKIKQTRCIFNRVEEIFNTKKEIEEAIFIVGKSGVGKTTLFHLLCDPNQIQVDQSTKYFVIQNKNQNDSAKISKNSNSTTKIPNIKIANIHGKKVYVIDCPGDLDDNGEYQDLKNAYLIYKVFFIVKKVRFLLCVEQGICISQRCNDLKGAISYFFSNFQKNQQNIRQIIKATSLVVMMHEKQQTRTFQKLSEFYKDMSENFAHQRQLLNEIVQNKKIYFIPKVNSQNKLSFLKKGQQIKQMQIKQSFLQINHKKDIKFQKSTSKINNELYQNIVECLKKPVKIIVNAIYQISNNFGLQQSLKKRNFIQEIKQYTDQQNVDFDTQSLRIKQGFLPFDRKKSLFNNKENQNLNSKIKIQGDDARLYDHALEKVNLVKFDMRLQQREFCQINFKRHIFYQNLALIEFHAKAFGTKHLKKQIEQKQKKNLLEKIILITKKGIHILFEVFEKLKQKAPINQKSHLNLFAKYISCFLNNILNYGYINDKQNQSFINFCFIISRNLLALQILENLSPIVEKKYSQLLSLLILDQKKVAELQVNFVMNFQIKQGFNTDSLSYAQKIISSIQMIDQSANENQKKNKKAKISNQNFRFKKEQNLINIKWMQGMIDKNITQLQRRAYVKCEIARRRYQKLNQEKNKDIYCHLNKNYYFELGNLTFNLKEFQLAIEYFKVIQYEQSIKKCYQSMKIDSNYQNIQKKVKIAIEYAQHLTLNCKIQKGIDVLQQCLEKIDLNSKNDISYKQIKKKIRQLKILKSKCNHLNESQQKLNEINTQVRPNQKKIYLLSKINEDDAQNQQLKDTQLVGQLKIQEQKENIENKQFKYSSLNDIQTIVQNSLSKNNKGGRKKIKKQVIQ